MNLKTAKRLKEFIKFKKQFDWINKSKIFGGLMVIMLNIGSKYSVMKFSPTQEAFLRNMITRQVLMFCMIWTATRDIVTTILLTAALHVLTEYMFNEKSRFCIIPRQYQKLEKVIDSNEDGEISDVELNKAINLLERAKQEKRQEIYTDILEDFQVRKI